ncbi:MAG: hypothetical protein K0Q49_742 [Haloplasmataceae bacterium]|jgi:hypothetical protein|nr:hypothetical protein [Haloplasmataceae bacterium]
MIGETGQLLSHNMYAYSKNNPVMIFDPNGYAAEPISLTAGLLIFGFLTLSAIIFSTPPAQEVIKDGFEAVGNAIDDTTKNTERLYNSLWSPGRSYYFADYNKYYETDLDQ